MTVKEFKNALSGNGVEGELIKTVVLSLVVSFASLGLLYFVKLKFIENFLPKYGFWIFFSILSYAIVLPSIRYVRAFKQFPCMSGMMIGMTIGMTIGFLSGYYIGATNGMFWGSVFGIVIGILLGVWNGKCCGIMGIMEGAMAGFMGGLMGAMTAVMMLNDHLKAAGVVVFVVCGVILVSLDYMLYYETTGVERNNKEDHMFTIVMSFLLTVITTWMIVYGPRSLLLQ